MGFRMKLANWISGGAFFGARERADFLSRKWTDSARIDAKRCSEIERLSRGLRDIIEATDGTKNGTAKMVNRMARHTLAHAKGKIE